LTTIKQQQLSEQAVSGFSKGYNCAESLVAALKEYFNRDDLPLEVATPFGAGLGGRRDLCGILTGGTLFIGLLAGRQDPADSERKKQAYKLAGAYYRWFKQSFGAVMCRDIVPGKFTGHTEVCEQILAASAAKLAELVEESNQD